MYNNIMIKRASKHDATISKGINKIALGFTIIETMLFLAIAGLIFAGLVAGTNGAIRRQRYKDSVQGFVDDLRDLYSLVENTQVLDYGGEVASCGGVAGTHEGRGRSNCSVYGIYAIISPNGKAPDNIEAYWVTGKDQATLSGYTSDKEFFKEAAVSTNILVGSELKKVVAKKHSILWGADVAIPCVTYLGDTHLGGNKPLGCEDGGDILSNNNNFIALFVYRSPVTGSISAYSAWMSTYNAAVRNGEILKDNITGIFHDYDINICVTGGSGMSYDGGIRMITIDVNGSNTNAVRLIEADSEDNKCNG
jgi:hypothetical protein